MTVPARYRHHTQPAQEVVFPLLSNRLTVCDLQQGGRGVKSLSNQQFTIQLTASAPVTGVPVHFFIYFKTKNL
jgi:hypothetical protein